MNKKYFSLEKHKQTATINIYGDITSFPWFEGDTSSANLSKQLEAMGDVNEINVYINSYGGEVAEGLAIYNALRRHKAKVKTVCDGFACSIASVVFMAGDERVMNDASLLMIHNAWTYASGNATELRKQADDLEKITQASIEAYKAHSTLTEEEIKALMDAETWILPSEAMTYGFATAIDTAESSNASQNARLQLFEIVRAHQAEEDETEDETDDSEEQPEEEPADDEQSEPDGEEPDDEQPEEPEKPADDETDEEDSEDEADKENEKMTAQKWSGFFNALLKM